MYECACVFWPYSSAKGGDEELIGNLSLISSKMLLKYFTYVCVSVYSSVQVCSFTQHSVVHN